MAWKVLFTFCWIALPLAGFRYRIVEARSLCPIQCWTVLRSTPARRCMVANVARNLCRYQESQYGPNAHDRSPLSQFPQFSLALNAMDFSRRRKWPLGLWSAVGNTSGTADFVRA